MANLIIIYLLQLFLRFTRTLDRGDFYDYSSATPFDKQQVKLTSPVPYPHWSDETNTQIDIASSGIARLSGFAGTNTLDVLVYATKIPFSNKEVLYEQLEKPNSLLKDNLKRDLATSQFTAKHVTIVTWLEVPYYPGRLSTFQIVFATDGNATFVILHIDTINHHKDLPYFPEVDLRYSYAEGTKSTRLGFLKAQTGVSTRSKKTVTAAEENSNCRKAGRWCFKVTDNPITANTTQTQATSTPPLVPPAGKSVTNSSGIGLKGALTFTTLLLGSNVLTDGENNDELSILLTKKDADQRYNTMNDNMLAYIARVYRTAANSTTVDVKILGYRTGSLIVEYSINVKSSTLCDGTTSENCLKKLKKGVETEIGNKDVQSGTLSGKIDPDKIEVTDFDECSVNTYCDFNANCVDYPNLLTFGCFCKEDYIGDGFPGNCRPKYAAYHFTSIVMYITIVVVILSLAFVTVVYYKIYKNEAAQNQLQEDKYGEKHNFSHGGYPRLPYGYGYGYGYGHGDNIYQRRFPGD